MAWLDAYVPDWWRYLEVKKLDIANSCKCVLGQLGGGEELPIPYDTINPYDAACSANQSYRNLLIGTALQEAPIMDDPYLFGFDFSDNQYTSDNEDYIYTDLTRRWKKVINDRRKAYKDA